MGMANKNLNSITFPGLPDTYIVPQVDTSLSISGRPADAKKVGDEITSVKQDLKFYIYGGSRTISINATGSQTIPFNFIKGVRYTFTNNRSTSCSLSLHKSDGSSTAISGAVNANASVSFVPDSNDYVGFGTWCANTGTVTITTEYANVDVYDNLETVINGNIPLGHIIQNTYITTAGNEANSSTRNATGFIPCESSWGVLSIYSDAMLGGDFCAFYDSSKTFISNFGYNAGLTEKAIPTNAKYVRFSINKTETSFKVIWWAKAICDKFEKIKYYKTFTENDVTSGFINSNGTFSSNTGWRATPFIYVPFVNGGTINMSSTLYGNGGLAFYDINKNVIYGINGSNASTYGLVSASTARKRVVTVPKGTYYIRASVYIYSTTTLADLWLMDGIGFNNVMDVIENNNTSIYAMNEQESMVTNAGANYGHHSSGTSNTEKRFSMLVTTDVHKDEESLQRAVDYLNVMPCFDCGVTLGDLQGNTFSDNDGTWYTNIIKTANKNWLTIIGNHDVGIGNSTSSTGDQEQVYGKFIEPNIEYAGATDTGHSYYYKDLSTYKIRIICLNAYDVDNDTISGSSYVVPRYTEYYSQAQIDWLVGVLENTPSDYHVMILTHSTPKASVKDTNVNFNDKTYSYSLEGTQNGIVSDIVNAWQNGSTLTADYACSNTNLSTVAVDADFSSRGSGAFICFLTGHVHVDVVGHVTAYPTQNVLAFSATSADKYQNGNSDLPRADGTKAEDCITALAVDTTNKQIYINRIGSSVSKWFTVREPSVIAYE